jgi:plasmid stabilization system protein ParE
MKIEISGAARRDLLAGYDFYEQQAPGISEYFLGSLSFYIDSLMISAGIHARHFGRYHRLLSRRFPYAVYYRIESDTVNVFAVLDCRRNSTWLRRQLGSP